MFVALTAFNHVEVEPNITLFSELILETTEGTLTLVNMRFDNGFFNYDCVLNGENLGNLFYEAGVDPSARSSKNKDKSLALENSFFYLGLSIVSAKGSVLNSMALLQCLQWQLEKGLISPKTTLYRNDYEKLIDILKTIIVQPNKREYYGKARTLHKDFFLIKRIVNYDGKIDSKWSLELDADPLYRTNVSIMTQHDSIFDITPEEIENIYYSVLSSLSVKVSREQ